MISHPRLQSNKGRSSEEHHCQVSPQPDVGTSDDVLHPHLHCVSGVSADQGSHPCGKGTRRLCGTTGYHWLGRDKGPCAATKAGKESVWHSPDDFCSLSKISSLPLAHKLTGLHDACFAIKSKTEQ